MEFTHTRNDSIRTSDDLFAALVTLAGKAKQ